MIHETYQTIVLEFAKALELDGNLRSRLRRAVEPLDTIGLDAADRFIQRLSTLGGKRGASEDSDDALSAVLILLAQRNVKNGTLTSVKLNHQGLASQLGEKKGDRRVLSELRFQRLLRAPDVQDQLLQMRRAIALLPQKAHPVHVLEAFLSLQSDSGRRKFARAYFNGMAVDETAQTPEAAA
jgi:CRISPR type I-E-associated protein CasB/Cse2